MKKENNMRKCSFPGCGKPHKAKGYCSGHWHQQDRGQELRPLRKQKSGAVRKGGEVYTIKGYRQASETLCIPRYQLQKLLSGTPAATSDPPVKVNGRGPQGWVWAWRDNAHLVSWHEEADGGEISNTERKEEKVVKTDESGWISGYAAAAKALGVHRSAISRAFAKAREKGMPDPPKEEVRGGQAYTWYSKEALLAWFEEANSDSSGVPTTSPRVVGVRAAASVLGVKSYVIDQELKRLKEEESDLLPSRARVQGSNGRPAEAYVWEDEQELVEWWEKVRKGREQKLPPARDEVIPEPLPPEPGNGATPDGEEVMIEALLGAGTTNALRELRERLDTAAVRQLRSARGEQPEIPLAEVLTLVVGLGLVNWPEE